MVMSPAVDDLGPAGCLLDRDASGAAAHPQRPGSVEPDIAGARLHLDIVETAIASEVGEAGCRRVGRIVSGSSTVTSTEPPRFHPRRGAAMPRRLRLP